MRTIDQVEQQCVCEVANASDSRVLDWLAWVGETALCFADLALRARALVYVHIPGHRDGLCYFDQLVEVGARVIGWVRNVAKRRGRDASVITTATPHVVGYRCTHDSIHVRSCGLTKLAVL